MQTVILEEAQNRLPELIEHLQPGEELLITQKTIARLMVAEPAAKPSRKLGTMKGTVRYMAPDFDAPLHDFKEYME